MFHHIAGHLTGELPPSPHDVKMGEAAIIDGGFGCGQDRLGAFGNRLGLMLGTAARLWSPPGNL
jgi:hypothetical protein